MTAEKVREVVGIYRRKFEELGIAKNFYPRALSLASHKQGLEHCHAMLDKIEEFIAAGRMEKVFRWLGFIQGFLWSQRIYTVGDLATHNRRNP